MKQGEYLYDWRPETDFVDMPRYEMVIGSNGRLQNKRYVYVIRNKANGKFYVGSSKDMRQRVLSHRRKLQEHKHPNKALQDDFDKYGGNAFEFSVVGMVFGYGKDSEELKMMRVLRTNDERYGYNTKDNTFTSGKRNIERWKKHHERRSLLCQSR